MSNYASLNGKLQKQDSICISPDNRSFRYGDGFFETIKIYKGEIVLADYHLERLYITLAQMYFDAPALFTRQYLEDKIKEVAQKNGHHQLGRVRLTIFRGDGGLYETINQYPNHLIQTWPLQTAIQSFNENGLVIDIYREATKNCDQLAQFKTNNYLCYSMAALWAKQQKLNDCLLLNPHGKLADATIANVFLVHNNVVTTPPLTDGPVNGIMRRHLLATASQAGVAIKEKSINEEDILSASEIFFTNAIYGIKWVRQLGNTSFTNTTSSILYRKCVAPLTAH